MTFLLEIVQKLYLDTFFVYIETDFFLGSVHMIRGIVAYQLKIFDGAPDDYIFKEKQMLPKH